VKWLRKLGLTDAQLCLAIWKHLRICELAWPRSLACLCLSPAVMVRSAQVCPNDLPCKCAICPVRSLAVTITEHQSNAVAAWLSECGVPPDRIAAVVTRFPSLLGQRQALRCSAALC
jgi:hypothetical protein